MIRCDALRLLYLSPVLLSSFAQRPHHFVHWFHQRYEGDVLWVDPGPSRLPRRSDWPRLVKHFKLHGPALGPDWRQAPWLRHVQAKVLPVEPWSWGRKINRSLWRDLFKQTDAFVTPETVLVLGKPCALSLALAQRYPQQRCIFDAMDHMPGFLSGVSRRWMVQAERALAEQADAIWASSHALAEHHSDHAGKVRLVLNGLTPTSIERAQSQTSNPVFGYLGVIDRWFDWDLVMALATAHPSITIELIGPVHVHPPRPLPSNVYCFPPVPQHQVYQAMARFNVALIPFVSNDVTAFVDPVKYYEYQALGLPVLSTRFGEMSHRQASDGVYFWDELLSGELDLHTLMSHQSDDQTRQIFCQRHNWARRFDSVADTLYVSEHTNP